MKLKYFLLFCCCFAGNALLAQEDNANWLLHTDTAFHFTVLHPDTWEFKLPNTTTRFFITSYKENDADNFRENINCIARKMDVEGFQISMAEETIKNSLKEKFPSFNLLSTGYVKWNNTDALQLSYTCNQDVNGAPVSIRLFQHVAILKGVLYTLTFTSMADTYDKYMGVVNKVIQSFKIE